MVTINKYIDPVSSRRQELFNIPVHRNRIFFPIVFDQLLHGIVDIFSLKRKNIRTTLYQHVIVRLQDTYINSLLSNRSSNIFRNTEVHAN